MRVSVVTRVAAPSGTRTKFHVDPQDPVEERAVGGRPLRRQQRADPHQKPGQRQVSGPEVAQRGLDPCRRRLHDLRVALALVPLRHELVDQGHL
jgi:hypothetical protein